MCPACTSQTLRKSNIVVTHIVRGTVVRANSEPTRRKIQQAKREYNNTKSVSVHEKILAFPTRVFFEKRDVKLFCGKCSEFISTHLITLKIHVRTKKHDRIILGRRRAKVAS